MIQVLLMNNRKSSDKFMSWWLGLLFIGLPLVNYSQVPQGYEIAKFIFWEAWWVGFVIWIIASGRLTALFSINTITLKLGWLFVIVLGLTAIQGGVISLFGSVFRKQGWVFFFQLWIFYLGLRSFDKETIRRSLWGLKLSVIILVSIGIIESLSGWNRISSTFGEPNAFAGYLALILPLILDRSWWWVGIWIVVGIILSGSRAAVLAIAGESTIFIIGVQQNIKIKLLFISIGLLVVVLTFLFFNSKNIRVSTVDNRFEIWQLSVKAIVARPFWGYGVDNIEGVLNKFVTNKDMGSAALVVDRSHSLILDLLLWSGIVGLLSFAGWSGSVILGYVKNIKTGNLYLISCVIGFLVFTAFNPASITMWVVFFGLLSMMDAKTIYG